MANKIHPAEKGRNLEEEAQVVVPAVTPAPATAPVNQADLAAQTYVDDGNGNIVPGPGVGIPAQTEQAVVTQPVTVGQPKSEVSEFAQGKAAAESGIPVVVQPAETVVAKPVANHTMDDQMKKIAEVEALKGQQSDSDQGTTVTTTPYLYDWSSGMSFNDAYKQNKHNAREIMDDQRRWAQENGKPLNVYDWASYLDHDADKTKEQNEAEIKKAEKKKKWDALGTFLTHLGNAVGAAGWGGSVKLEDPVKLSERQREIFEKTQALRRQRNKEMMDAYMKQYNADRQAKLDAANLEYRKAMGESVRQKADDNTRKTNAQIEEINGRKVYRDALTGQVYELLPVKKEKIQADTEKSRKQGNAAAQNAATASFNAHATTTSVTTDANGNQKTTVRSKGTSGNGGKGKSKSAFGSRTSGKSAFGKR